MRLSLVVSGRRQAHRRQAARLFHRIGNPESELHGNGFHRRVVRDDDQVVEARTQRRCEVLSR
ncbi:MAG: hypothetical protein KDB70_16150 [Mycobacterium sp.]|nr:hypothetical protein [Mycobacterium sp.]